MYERGGAIILATGTLTQLNLVFFVPAFSSCVTLGGSVLYIETVASKRVRQPVSKDAEAGVHTDTPGFGLTGMWPDDCCTRYNLFRTMLNFLPRPISLKYAHMTQVPWAT